MSKFWEYLYSLRNAGMKYELTRMKNFLNETGNPERNYKIIHIVGTNGKGSTASFLNRLLIENGRKTGCFRSPHLYSPVERIVINDQFIEEDYIFQWYEKYKPLVEKHTLSFFEIFTALALHYFNDMKCEWVVLEAGLGGRLDATNVVMPEAVIVTKVSIDHHRILGDTVELITGEKIEVIKSNLKVFLGKQSFPVVKELTAKKAEKENSRLFDLEEEIELELHNEDFSGSEFSLTRGDIQFRNLKMGMLGKWQVENAVLALLAFLNLDIQTDERQIRNALLKTRWHGRLEKISDEPLIYTDVSHNPDGLEKTIDFVRKYGKGLNREIHFIFSVLARKDHGSMLRSLRESGFRITFVPIEYHQGLSYEEMTKILDPEYENWELEKEFRIDIIEKYKDKAIFILGSHFLLSEIVPRIKKHYSL